VQQAIASEISDLLLSGRRLIWKSLLLRVPEEDSDDCSIEELPDVCLLILNW
jgi:hypothetical protein